LAVGVRGPGLLAHAAQPLRRAPGVLRHAHRSGLAVRRLLLLARHGRGTRARAQVEDSDRGGLRPGARHQEQLLLLSRGALDSLAARRRPARLEGRQVQGAAGIDPRPVVLDGDHRPRHLPAALAVPVAPPGGSDWAVPRLPHAPCELPLVLPPRAAAGTAFPALLRAGADRAHRAAAAVRPDGHRDRRTLLEARETGAWKSRLRLD